jgi:hypothetical protein
MNVIDPLVEPLGLLAPLDLEELDATAALLVRRDRKYIVRAELAAEALARLASISRILEIEGRRRFRYESVYFDTPDRASYLGAARRRRWRFKVRTRSYLDSGRCLIEVKTRDPRGRTVKVRREHPIASRERLDAAARAFAGRCQMIGASSAVLAPALLTRYVRATLCIGPAAGRVTLDTDLEARTPDGRVASLPGMVIIETKSAGPPSEADRVLWSLGARPVRVSKFCTGLAAMRPELPANRWGRALRYPWHVIGAGPGGPELPARPAVPADLRDPAPDPAAASTTYAWGSW